MRSRPSPTYSDGMSQQASRGGDPYPPDWYGTPSVWGPPVSVPGAFGADRALGPELKASPGWTARILFWVALVIGSLPEIVMMPMLITGIRPDLFILYSSLTVVVAVLELVVAIVALLALRGSPMRMRLFGAGLFFVITIYALILPYVMPNMVNRIVGGFGGFELAVGIQSIIWSFHTGVVLTGTLTAWNLARGRVWWTNLVAAGYALVMGLVVAFVEWAMNSLGSSFAMSVVLTQLAFLGMAFGGLGLLHVLGRFNSGPETPKGPLRLESSSYSWHPRG